MGNRITTSYEEENPNDTHNKPVIDEPTTNLSDSEEEDEKEPLLLEEKEKTKDIPSQEENKEKMEEIAETAESNTDAIAKYLEFQRKADMGFFDQITDFNIKQELNADSFNIISFDNAVSIIRQNNKQTVRQGYIMLDNIIRDETLSYQERAACVNYLVSTNLKEFLNTVEDFEMEMVKDTKLDSKEKYRLVMAFVDNRGWTNARIKTQDWGQPIMNEIQWLYFNDTSNYIRFRILSGQWLLGQSYALATSRRTFVNEVLADIMHEDSEEENVRADVADVLIRYGNLAFKEEAQEVIEELGFRKGGYTVYDNAQNVHNEEINESITKFIEEELVKDKIPVISYEAQVHAPDCPQEGKCECRVVTYKRIQTILDIAQEIKEKVENYEIKLDSDQLDNLMAVMERISLDTATFTKRNMRTSEILQRVWNKIQKKQDHDKEELTKRLLEELLDSHDTCSSGHISRIVNILSGGHGVEIKISWRDQIIANVKGRLNALIRKMTITELRGDLIVALAQDCKEDELRILRSWVESVQDELFRELRNEFVDQGQHVTEKEFSKHFTAAICLFTRREVPDDEEETVETEETDGGDIVIKTETKKDKEKVE